MESKHDWDYYSAEAKKLYNNQNEFNRVLNETEIFINPYFNAEIREHTLKEAYNKRRANRDYDYEPPKPAPLPKCPTCQSTNIKKISFAKGYIHWRMLGVFSKTAMSQWECKSCGSKF